MPCSPAPPPPPAILIFVIRFPSSLEISQKFLKANKADPPLWQEVEVILQERPGRLHLSLQDNHLLGSCIFGGGASGYPDLVTPAQSSRFGGKGVWRWREIGSFLKGGIIEGQKGS